VNVHCVLGQIDLPNGFSLLAATAFLVPGYVWTQVESKFIPRKRIEWSERILGYLAYSSLNYFVWFLVFLRPLVEATLAGSVGLAEGFEWVCVLFVGPAAGGLVTGLGRRADWIGALLNRFGINTYHPIDSAWEYCTSRPQQAMARVHLKSGEEHFGWFGRRSIASSDPRHSDIFLQERLVNSASDSLDTEPGTLGIWIPGSEIEWISFYKHDGEGGGNEQERRKE